MSHICPKIFATNYVPPATKFILHLPLYYSCDLAVLLSFENALEISNLLDGRIGDADNNAFLFRCHIRVSDKNFFGGSILWLIIELDFLLIGSDVVHNV